MGIVYEIRNLINNKPYVGSSERGFKERCLWEHRAELRKDEHSHNSHLQRSWNKYGEENFEFNVLVEIQDDYVIKAEQYWIDKLNAYEDGYNLEKYAHEAIRNRMVGEDNPMWNGGPVELICKECGDEYKVIPSRAGSSKTCSIECRSNYHTGENHPRFKEYPSRDCNYCGEEYEYTPAIEDITKYCKQSCKSKDQNSGKDNGRWKGGKVTLKCKNCGDSYDKKPSEVADSKYCSNSCQSRYQNKGKNNGNSKLRESEVIEIKKLLKNSDFYLREIADKFDVSLSCIGDIKYGHSWEYVEV